MVGFFERSPKNRSMMRLLAFLGFIIGGVVTIWGLVLVTLLINAGVKGNPAAFSTIGSISMIIGGGLALAGSGELLKVFQQRSEAKDQGGKNETVDVESDSSTSGNSATGGGL